MARAKEEEQQVTFPLTLGIDNTSQPLAVQPYGPEAALIASTNTRLSKSRGVPSKAPDYSLVTSGATDADVPCMGIVPAGNVDSSVAFFHRGAKRIAGSQLDSLDGTVNPLGVNSYVPAQVSRAGALPGGSSWNLPALGYDSVNGRTWIASLREYGTADSAIYLSCVSDDGELLVQPTKAVTMTGSLTPTSYLTFFGFTTHGANGVLFWYRDPGTYGAPSNVVKVVLVSITDLSLSLGTATTIYTPVVALANQICVTADSDDYAYLVCVDSATNTTVVITRLALDGMTTSSVSETSFCSATATLCAKNYVDEDGNNYLAVVVADGASGANIALYNGEAMTRTWGPTTGLLSPATAAVVGFYVADGSSYVAFAISDVAGDLPTLNKTETGIQFRSLSAGTLTSTVVVPWMVPIAHAATLKINGTEVFPLFVMQRTYDDAPAVTSEMFITDPSVEVFRPDGTSSVTCIGRFGVDTARALDTTSARHSAACYSYGDKFFLTYLEASDRVVYNGSSMRYAEMDFGAGQPRYALTPEGSALIAGALPAHWDGVELTELAPLHRPTIHVADSGGSGATLSAAGSGRYRFAVVHSWYDANGVVHRSMPSVTREVTGASMEVVVSVARPVSMRDGVRQEKVKTTIYATDEDGTILYAQGDALTNLTSSSDYFDTYGYVAQPVISDQNPPIYTDGDASMPLMSQCPPAARDIAIVGNRAWLINAEYTSEVWPSKEREFYVDSYVSYEFYTDLVIQFPATAGELLAVVESNGLPIFLSRTGVWAVTGAGPDNSLGGQSWNPPEQLSDIPCTDGKSVIKCPAGVLFISNNRFVVWSGQARVVEGVDASLLGSVVSAIVIRDESEVLFVGTSGTSYVYNYSLDRWSTWDSNALPTSTCAAAVPKSGDILLYSETVGQFYLVDTDAASTHCSMTFTTGHIQLGGPQDDNVVQEILLHGLYTGAHGVTATITTDYGATTTTRTFTEEDVLACVVNGQYTLSMSPGTMSMRTVKISLSETSSVGEAFRPTAVTIVYTKNPGTMRSAIRAAGRK